MKRIKVTLASKYDNKEATVLAEEHGQKLWITARQEREARKRAKLIGGDYFKLPENLCIAN